MSILFILKTYYSTFSSRSFRFRVEDYDLCVYGVFDGFGGAQVADFVTKRIPAELLWGQLVPEKSGENNITLSKLFILIFKPCRMQIHYSSILILT